MSINFPELKKQTVLSARIITDTLTGHHASLCQHDPEFHIIIKRHVMEEVLVKLSPLFAEGAFVGHQPENMKQAILALLPEREVWRENLRSIINSAELFPTSVSASQQMNGAFSATYSLHHVAAQCEGTPLYSLYLILKTLNSMMKEFPHTLDVQGHFDHALKNTGSYASWERKNTTTEPTEPSSP